MKWPKISWLIFGFWIHEIAQAYQFRYPYCCLTLSNRSKCYFYVGRHIFSRKIKIQHDWRQAHVLSNFVKISSDVLQTTEIIVVCIQHFLTFRNNDDKFGSFMTEYVNGLSCTCDSQWVSKCRYYWTLQEMVVSFYCFLPSIDGATITLSLSKAHIIQW